MSDEEVVVLVVCIVGSLITWAVYYFNILQLHRFYKAKKEKLVLAFTPVFCAAGLFVLLKNFASFDVVNNPTYILFYSVMGALWVRLCFFLLRYMGIYWIEDALERKNAAALLIVLAFMIGATICYSGANIGDGPGWWCVVFAGGLATLVWLSLWQILNVSCSLSEKITVERDLNAAIRSAGYGIGSSIVCGRGAAGDWSSAQQTVEEFFCAWPVLIMLVIAIVFEKYSTQPQNEQNPLEQKNYLYWDIIISISFIIAAIIIVYLSPQLPNNPIYENNS